MYVRHRHKPSELRACDIRSRKEKQNTDEKESKQRQANGLQDRKQSSNMESNFLSRK